MELVEELGSHQTTILSLSYHPFNCYALPLPPSFLQVTLGAVPGTRDTVVRERELVASLTEHGGWKTTDI